MLFSMHTLTLLRTRNTIAVFFEVELFMIASSAMLSVWRMMHLLRNFSAHTHRLAMMGYSSRKEMDRECHSSGHLP